MDKLGQRTPITDKGPSGLPSKLSLAQVLSADDTQLTKWRAAYTALAHDSVQRLAASTALAHDNAKRVQREQARRQRPFGRCPSMRKGRPNGNI